MPFVISMTTVCRDAHYYIEVYEGEKLVEKLDAGETQAEAEAMLEDLLKMAVGFGGKRIPDAPV